jgi:hypothetical protein
MSSSQSAASPSRSRGTYGRAPLTLDQLSVYNPNRADATEAIWQPYYDFQTYATTGATSMIFFQTPSGQGGKTFADTNMVSAGQFPAPTAFLCTAIMVAFFPGANTSITGTAAAASANFNDVVSLANGGYLEFTIGSKVYLRDAPLGKFAPNFTVNGISAVALASGATTIAQTQTGFARAAGRYYEITPFLVPQNQNFNISLYWPTAVTVTNAGRIGLIMDGFYYRQSQ